MYMSDYRSVYGDVYRSVYVSVYRSVYGDVYKSVYASETVCHLVRVPTLSSGDLRGTDAMNESLVLLARYVQIFGVAR